jgi:predicted small metal-binding protein
MRVIECNICGETLSASGDDELTAAVRRHLDDEHSDQEISDDEVAQIVSDAYDATDS